MKYVIKLMILKRLELIVDGVVLKFLFQFCFDLTTHLYTFHARAYMSNGTVRLNVGSQLHV